MTQDTLNTAIALNNELQVLVTHRDSIIKSTQPAYASVEEDDEEEDERPRKKINYAASAAKNKPAPTSEFEGVMYKGINLKLSILFDTSDPIQLYLSKLEMEITRVQTQLSEL